MAKNILFIHQSAELYGSDKTLYYLVKDLKLSVQYEPIVVLPCEGPLKEKLHEAGIFVVINPVIKLSRQTFSPKNLFFLPVQILKAVKELEKQLNGKKIDLVHSNTLAVLLGAFYSRYKKIPHLWHVHEIITHPKIVSDYIYPFLVNSFTHKIIYNSIASKVALCKGKKSLINKSTVIWNGIDRNSIITSKSEIRLIRGTLFNAEDNEIVIGLVGRINRWKGQELLLEAFNSLVKEGYAIKLVFVGSCPPNQKEFLINLQEKIANNKLQEKCSIVAFQKDIWTIYDSLDIVVVPSKEPEPFGLVALEGMLSKKPVIAASHGGLKEIVVPKETGFLFEPNNVNDLIHVLKEAIENEKQRCEMGAEGFLLAKKKFSLKEHSYKIQKIYKQLI